MVRGADPTTECDTQSGTVPLLQRIKIRLQNLPGGVSVESGFALFARQADLVKVVVGGLSREALVLPDHAAGREAFEFVGEVARERRLLPFGAVHVERQADHNGRCGVFVAQVGHGAGVAGDVVAAGDGGEGKGNTRLVVTMGDADALATVIDAEDSHGWDYGGMVWGCR